MTIEQFRRNDKVTGFRSDGIVLTTGPLGVRVRFTSGRMVQEQGAKGYFDMDPTDLRPTDEHRSAKA